MLSIVEYTDSKPPLLNYPHRIVSPSKSSNCCRDNMVRVGEDVTCHVNPLPFRHFARDIVYCYKRCVVCGYTVKLIVSIKLGEEFVCELQDVFRREHFIRGWLNED